MSIINIISSTIDVAKWGLILGNSISYWASLCSCEPPFRGQSANLRTLWDNLNGCHVYLVAGCGNQPESAFQFILPYLKDYGVTMVDYLPGHVCDMETIAEQVVNDAKLHDYQRILVIGISIGDYVGRIAENRLGKIAYSIGINPEPDSRLLKTWAKVALRVGVPVAEAVSCAAGWLSKIRWYSDCGNHFSSTFIVSQFREIAFRRDAPRVSKRMLGMILAEADQKNGKGEDEFLLGRDAMRKYFGKHVPIYSAKGVGHGNTVKGAFAYERAWKELWARAEPILLKGLEKR